MTKLDVAPLMFYLWVISSTVLTFGYWIFGETPYSLEILLLLWACSALAILFEFWIVFGIATVIDWINKIHRRIEEK